MRLAGYPLPRTNAVGTDTGEEDGGLHFCSLADAVARFSARTAGKKLFVSDGDSGAALAFAARAADAVAVVLDGRDGLPLFSAPDGVGGVFAAGRADTLRAARFFAAVRKIPCAVAPYEGACFGIFEDMGSVFLDGARENVPLAAAEIFCDPDFMRPTLGDARARVSLARLARFEARALGAFGVHRRELCEVRIGDEASAADIVRANLALRGSEKEGAWPGEGAVLAALYPRPDAWRAFCELSALYFAFLKGGVPRKYLVPDYAARAARAGKPYAEVRIPTAEEYARRALALERRRADLLTEIELILRDKSSESRSVYAFSGKTAAFGGPSEELKELPEHCADGLCAVIRDFGLMEGI